MKAAEIRDQDGLEAWLKEQPKEVCVWIAARAAARVLPIFWQEVAQNTTARDGNLTALPICRALLTAASFAHAADAAVKKKLAYVAAFAATDADAVAGVVYAFAYNDPAASATRNSADAASDAASAAASTAALNPARDAASDAANATRDAPTAAAFDDARWVEAHGVSAECPLWPEGMPDDIAQAWQATLDALPEAAGDQPDYHGFWVPWYQGLLSGHPAFPRALTEAVALIEEDDWKKGDLHINNTVIPRLMAEHAKADAARGERSALSQAFPVDFTFDSLARVMRMVGIDDDMAHLRDPAVVQSFLDDCEELRDSLQDFADYAEAGREGKNRIAMLHLAASKVLAELQRTKDMDHLRARHIVQLARRLEAFSKEEGARDDLGETLSAILDDSIGLLRTVTRKHFGPAYTALAPLSQLTLDHVDQDEVVALFDRMIARLEALPSDELVPLDEDGLSVFRDMIRELHEFRAAIAEASSDEFRQLLEQRFAESIGGTGLAFGRFMETSSAVASQVTRGVDGAVKTYKQVQSLGDIRDFILEFLNLGGTQ